VPTKMGGSGAPDDIDQGHLTQVWLAAGDDPEADVTGQYFYHLKRMEPNAQAQDPALQDRLIAICAENLRRAAAGLSRDRSFALAAQVSGCPLSKAPSNTVGAARRFVPLAGR
jgi:hypothetical protein